MAAGTRRSVVGARRLAHLWRKTILPRVKSYGESASVTRSPASTRMRNLRILPAIVASTEWPFSSVTRNVELRSSSATVPWISKATSFVTTDGPPLRVLTLAAAALDPGPVPAQALLERPAELIGAEFEILLAGETARRPAVGDQRAARGGAVRANCATRTGCDAHPAAGARAREDGRRSGDDRTGTRRCAASRPSPLTAPGTSFPRDWR